jgi:hypothetical protein
VFRYVISGGGDASVKLYRTANLDAFLATMGDTHTGLDTQALENLIEELPIERTIELHEKPITSIASNHVILELFTWLFYLPIFL